MPTQSQSQSREKERERKKQCSHIDLDLAPRTAVKLGIFVDIRRTSEQTDTQNKK